MSGGAYSVYFLRTCAEPTHTYIGCTNNLERRLRQHNCELVGGARKTTAISKNRGSGAWKRVCYVDGFGGQIEALRFEWWWKFVSRKRVQAAHPVKRRVLALQALLQMDRWSHLDVKWEDDECPEL